MNLQRIDPLLPKAKEGRVNHDLHLLLPLASSLMLVLGLLVVKRATLRGVSAWTAAFLSNLWAAVLLSPLLLTQTIEPSLSLLWQPVLVSLLYITGQLLTFLAVEHGDVSVATPVFSVKVLLVAVFLILVLGETIHASVWIAAVFAVSGVILVQRSNRGGHHGNVLPTILIALAAATSFSLCDVLIQWFAPIWGANTFLPLVFLSAGCLSIVMVPVIDRPRQIQPDARLPLLAGSLLVALNASVLVFTLARFGDAARVNIVYALRGPFGVLLAWLLARRLQTSELQLPRNVMVSRMAGALLVMVAVVIVITMS